MCIRDSHRIIKVQPSSYTLCGDNTYTFETGIMKEQILGVMTGFYRKSTYISCNRAGYRLSLIHIYWRIPEHGETNKMCINCSLLNNLLSELRNTVGYNKNHTILIWHKPMDDICENIKYSYDGKWYTFKAVSYTHLDVYKRQM